MVYGMVVQLAWRLPAKGHFSFQTLQGKTCAILEGDASGFSEVTEMTGHTLPHAALGVTDLAVQIVPP